MSPFRLRVDANVPSSILETFVRNISSIEYVGKDFYIDFRTFSAIRRAFEETAVYPRRMVDPYALHVTIPPGLSVRDVGAYFSTYGRITYVTEHVCGNGRYVFVNFMRRASALRALREGSVREFGPFTLKVRAKVLSAAEPVPPKPYSPSRSSSILGAK